MFMNGIIKNMDWETHRIFDAKINDLGRFYY